MTHKQNAVKVKDWFNALVDSISKDKEKWKDDFDIAKTKKCHTILRYGNSGPNGNKWSPPMDYETFLKTVKKKGFKSKIKNKDHPLYNYYVQIRIEYSFADPLAMVAGTMYNIHGLVVDVFRK